MKELAGSDRLRNAPLGTKAPALMGGYWIKVANGWKWFCGDTFPTVGGDWDGSLIYPDAQPETLIEALEMGL